MAMKFLTHKKHNGIKASYSSGLQAPRNSLEMPLETTLLSYAAGDNVLLSYQVDEDLCQNKHYSSDASMKKLIDEDIYKRKSTRQKAYDNPSVVARLMGMEMLLSDTKQVIQPLTKNNEFMENNILEKERLKKEVNSSSQPGIDRFHQNKHSGRHDSSRVKMEKKPTKREHPQEEELQRFKKEFEAWQAERFKECSKHAEAEDFPRIFSQENRDLGKMSLNSKSGEITTHKSHIVKESKCDKGGSQNHEYTLNLSPVDEDENIYSRNQIKNTDLVEQIPLVKSYGSSRIVILKPAPDKITSNEESSWTCSSSSLTEKSSIEDFLVEVRERLNCELQGKTFKRSSVARGSGTETPYSETPSFNPKKIARQISKQVRENVTRDIEINLPRSESTRSCRNEIHFNGQDSPEFMKRDTRMFLSERLRNLLKNASDKNNHVNLGIDGSKIAKDGLEIQSRSFRYEPEDQSPMNLIRSLSAPVSPLSFGKLLLEDRHVLTGVHITRRKHEDIEQVNVKKHKKERFDIRKKVSNMKSSLTLRGKLFRRKFQSMGSIGEFPRKEHDIMSMPKVIMNFRYRPDNSTEVPPSPASVCSSMNDEFWRPTGCLSPISSVADVHSIDDDDDDDDTMPQSFKDISSNLNELRRQLNQLESNEFEDTPIKELSSSDDMAELENPIEAYIRDLLVASGLYDGSSDKSFLAKPICSKVFEELEESNKGEDHKVIYDLLNEALATLVGPPVNISKLRRKINGFSRSAFPHGRELLNILWEIIWSQLYPPTDKLFYSIYYMISRDLQAKPWSRLIDDENNEIGRVVECWILGDLIEEIVTDMK